MERGPELLLLFNAAPLPPPWGPAARRGLERGAEFSRNLNGLAQPARGGVGALGMGRNMGKSATAPNNPYGSGLGVGYVLRRSGVDDLGAISRASG